MDQVKNALTQKIGPLPGWAWAGIAALGVVLIWPMVSGGLSSATSAASSGSSGAGSNSGSDSSGPAGPPGPPGPPGSSGSSGSSLNSYGYPTAAWAALTEHQKEYWKLHHRLPPVGGPAVSIGSRSAVHMAAHHPDLKRTVKYPQLVRAVGGAAAHQANIHRVAAQTGVHTARLMALNPHYTGLIRIA